MKYLLTLASVYFIMLSCEEPRTLSSTNPVNWQKRALKTALSDSLNSGSTFLSIYSQIFVRNDEEKTDLTATVSLHNPNRNDTIYVDKAAYYNTHGEPIRTYFDNTIFIKPMETVQIVIDGHDQEGGTGANFVFDWSTAPYVNEPVFEAVMISNYGQQGISFVTQGKRVK